MHNYALLSVENGVDYQGQTVFATFEPDEMQSTISINITDDTLIESDRETFRLDIDDSDFPDGFIKFNPHTAHVAIFDDDCK